MRDALLPQLQLSPSALTKQQREQDIPFLLHTDIRCVLAFRNGTFSFPTQVCTTDIDYCRQFQPSIRSTARCQTIFSCAVLVNPVANYLVSANGLPFHLTCMLRSDDLIQQTGGRQESMPPCMYDCPCSPANTMWSIDCKHMSSLTTQNPLASIP